MREATRTFLHVPEGHKAEFSTGTTLSLILFHKSSPPRWKIEIKLDFIFTCHVITFLIYWLVFACSVSFLHHINRKPGLLLWQS